MTLLANLMAKAPPRMPRAAVQSPPPFREPTTPRTIPVSDQSAFISVVAAEHSKPQSSRLYGHSRGGHIHLSSLLDFCPRQVVLAADSQAHAVRTDRVDPNMRLTWAIGRCVEKELRDAFIAGHGAANVYGSWRCACRQLHWEHDWGRPGERCTRCGTRPHYVEAPFIDSALGIIGSPDIIFRPRADAIAEIVEIKSMKKDNFEALVEPNFRHVLQAAGYHRLAAPHIPVSHRVRVVYATKGVVRGLPYKEYVQSADDPAVAGRLDNMWAAVRQLRQSRASGRLPERTCRTPTDGARVDCPVVVDCFCRGT